jgi:hypothetical protein
VHAEPRRTGPSPGGSQAKGLATPASPAPPLRPTAHGCVKTVAVGREIHHSAACADCSKVGRTRSARATGTETRSLTPNTHAGSAPSSFRRGPDRAHPRRLRVRYERAGRSFYSAAAAGGAKMTPQSDRSRRGLRKTGSRRNSETSPPTHDPHRQHRRRLQGEATLPLGSVGYEAEANERGG